MHAYFLLAIIITTLWKPILSLDVIGTINEDCQFYYRKLSNIPSTLTTIEYFISYNQSIILVENSTDLVMGIYTTEDNINLETKCSNAVYGQLRNDSLHTCLRQGTYRSTKCVL